MRSIDESRISSSARKANTSSLHLQMSEDIKPPLTGSPVDSNAATVDEDAPSVTSSPPTDIPSLTNSFHHDWELNGGGSMPLIWNDPMASITGQQWGTNDLSFNHMGITNGLSGMDILRQDFGGFPGLTGGETLPTQPFMPFGIPGPSATDVDYYPQQYGFSQDLSQEQPRQLTEEDVEALNQFLTQHQHPG